MTDTSANQSVASPYAPMGFVEFVLLVAAIMALNPLALDVMLPALPDIGSAFGITYANHLQLVLSAFLLGFGAGQFVIGPLSDRFGRRRVLVGGMMLYVFASVVAVVAYSFEALLLARLLQGISTSATRVIATSVVRDCFAGRRMASVMSLAQMVFVSVPILAPSLGQMVLVVTEDWRSVFVLLMVYGIAILAWTAFRLPETLPLERRASLTVRDVLGYFRETITNRQTIGYAVAGGAVQGTMFAFIFSAQQVFTEVYQLGRYFPLAFAAIAVGVALAGLLNARLVGRLGMRIISHAALLWYVGVSAVTLAFALTGWLPLSLYVVLVTASLFSFGLTFANFTSLAMEQQGHIAGTASSLFGSITTLIGMTTGYVIGQAYNGTVVPLTIGLLLSALFALVVVLLAEKGRLFHL